MSDIQKELRPEDLPPVNLPSDLRIQVIGFEEELAKTVGNEIAAIVADLSRYWPLTNLVGVTVSYDYATALAGIDRGFGKSLPPPQATNDEELGQGSAMAVSVIHDGIWKTHVVFGPYVVNMLSSENDGENITGTKLVAHELAHAVDHENKRRAFGEICLQSVIELIPDPKEQYLWEKSHFIWDEYFASRLSVAFDPDGEPYEDELFATAYIACRNRLREARRKYHWHEISLEEFLEILGHNLRMVILSAGYLFGLCDGLNKDFSEVAPQSAPLLQEPLGLSIMRFHSVLLALWENRGEWTSYNEFLAMNAPAEALLNDLDLFVHTTDDGMVYMDIPARLEHVGLN